MVLFNCLKAYQLLMGYLMLKFDPFANFFIVIITIFLVFIAIFKCTFWYYFLHCYIKYSYLININLHLVVWFQVFLSNTNNFQAIICFK